MVNDKKPNILIVEDDSSINNLIYDALKKHGCDCVQAYSGTEGILNFKNAEFDLVILDLMMPGMTGEELTRQIRENHRRVSQVLHGIQDRPARDGRGRFPEQAF